MVLREEDLKVLREVPAENWHILMHLAKYLAEAHTEHESNNMNNPVRHGEWVEGEIWMSEDFNDPLEFVSESEMHVLDVMREPKQEAAV
ncbi:MAG: hypothetical protein IJG34_09270 [Synergistaceae bacterium]|nr:hypothetical protein [Synergistaceae bacterium]MBQ3450068.1 hypothetical protein [Synergistaceae bacterium]MBQ3694056.1 hypothetical protein [Synergistaceae bacterium]MBQ9628912.1 hypothetical protein [Synergistaceae bacterium]MBR0070467.1 hypothetical protein [Synergistaceae bacterium]